MRTDWTELEQFRILRGPIASKTGDHFGAFFISLGKVEFIIIADDGADTGWEHVSMRTRVNRKTERCPTWAEMNWLKETFWEDNETVLQFHPPKAEYINLHPHVLHLWKQVGVEAPRPPSILVGPNLQRNIPD